MSLAMDSTATELTDADISFFAELVDKKIGVQLAGKGYLIDSRLKPLLSRFGATSTSALIAAIKRGDRAAESAAIDAMTTNETSFYRDQHPFATLAEHVIPPILAKTGSRLTIWNGACSSGQESYSLAMTLREQFPEAARIGRTRIVSTDVSAEMVERTKLGTYSRFEVNRGLPANQAVKYFEQQGRSWKAKKEISDLIDAHVLNLLEPWPTVPKCDIVLLRNVLIYFTPEVKGRILNRIRTEVLADHGCLMLGATETPMGFDDGYVQKRLGDSNLYFKKGA